MDTGLFTCSHNPLQLIVFRKAQCNRDFIQAVFGENRFQLIRSAQDRHSIVHTALLRVIIEDSVNLIPPLGILPDPVYVSFSCRAAAHHHHVLEVHPPAADSVQHRPDDIPLDHQTQKINPGEQKQHLSGEVLLPDDVQTEDEHQKSDHIGQEDVPGLYPFPGYSSRLIEPESVIQEKIRRNYKDQRQHVG